jgi:hypothetical protein
MVFRVVPAVLDHQPRPRQFPGVLAEKGLSQVVFGVCNGHGLEHSARFPRFALDVASSLDRPCQRLPRGYVAHDVVPWRQGGVAAGVDEGFGHGSDAQRAEVVAAHGGRDGGEISG